MRSFHYGLWEHELFPACLNPSNCYSYFFLFFFKIYLFTWASLIAQWVKNPPAVREPRAWSLGWEDPLEKGKATTPVFRPGELHRLHSPRGRQEWGLGDFRSALAHLFIWLWLSWASVAARGLSPLQRAGSPLRLHGPGISPQWPVLLQSVGFNSRIAGPSSCGAQVSVRSPQSGAWAHIPCAGRQSLNHRATRETLSSFQWSSFLLSESSPVTLSTGPDSQESPCGALPSASLPPPLRPIL